MNRRADSETDRESVRRPVSTPTLSSAASGEDRTSADSCCPSAHAIRAAIEEARQAKEEGSSRVILFNLSGHGHFDMSAYDAYLAGKLATPVGAMQRVAAG